VHRRVRRNPHHLQSAMARHLSFKPQKVVIVSVHLIAYDRDFQFMNRLVLIAKGVPIRFYLELALIANFSSTGIKTTANGVPASSDTIGSGAPNSLPPSIEFS
jgi:hypothetical protein